MISLLIKLVALLPFYLIGCFPTGWLVGRLHGVDISQEGSGNVGATNVSRVLGKRAGVFALLGDVGKGIVAVLAASAFSSVEWYVAGAGAAVVCGHCFSLPPWLKGGKGVATALGVTMVLFPMGALVALVSFIGVFAYTRIVSIASLVATGVVPLVSLLSNQGDSRSLALVVVACVIVLRHRPNIVRLIEGTEPKFVFRR